MTNKIVITIAFLNCFWCLQAQKMLEGQIFIDDYVGEIQTVSIKNLTQDTQVLTTNYRFRIPIQLGDSLLFESNITEERIFVINQSIYQKGKLNIHLNRYLVVLRDLEVNRVLTGYLDQDIASVRLENNDSINDALKVSLGKWDMANMEREMIIQPMNGEMPSNIDFIKIGALLINAFKSKRVKPKPKPVKLKTLDEIRAYLGDDFFIEIGIPIAEIDVFMEYTLNTANHLLRLNYLDIIRVFSEAVEGYRFRDNMILE